MARPIEPAPRTAILGKTAGVDADMRQVYWAHPDQVRSIYELPSAGFRRSRYHVDMSTESGGTGAIIAALLANLGIAVTKFIAYLVSGASSMLAEAVHSFADSGNQILLLIGGKRAKKVATPEHPFGYGRVRYLYAFIVSIILFSVGGVFAIYEGIEKIGNPHPLETWWLAVAVLVISMALESFSLRTALKESKPYRKDISLVGFVRRAKSPELPVVLLEDTAALTGLVFALAGVGLTVITENGLWDGIGTLCIGVLLVVVAVVLGIETKSLLIGEGANPDTATLIAEAMKSTSGVARIIHMKTLYLGPDELLVAAKIAVPGITSAADVAHTIDAAESRIREAVPIARVIYLEPDIDRELV